MKRFPHKWSTLPSNLEMWTSWTITGCVRNHSFFSFVFFVSQTNNIFSQQLRVKTNIWIQERVSEARKLCFVYVCFRLIDLFCSFFFFYLGCVSRAVLHIFSCQHSTLDDCVLFCFKCRLHILAWFRALFSQTFEARSTAGGPFCTFIHSSAP